MGAARGCKEVHLHPPLLKTDFPGHSAIKRTLSLVKQIQTNDVLNIGIKKIAKSQQLTGWGGLSMEPFLQLPQKKTDFPR